MKYRTIVADPPWPVGGSTQDGRPWCGKGGRRTRATFFPYQVMPLEWIEALPVAAIAEPDAHLYLWVPARLNRRGVGVRVANAWGFEDVAEIVWKKPNFGLGKFPRPQHEILLVCRHGTLPFRVNNVGSVQEWRQMRDGPSKFGGPGKTHSAKPQGSYDLIEQASPPPYVELFARRHRLGWDVWGDESANTAKLPA
jgi:N6-adenosine-specific RNA methylase IME4